MTASSKYIGDLVKNQGYHVDQQTDIDPNKGPIENNENYRAACIEEAVRIKLKRERQNFKGYD